MRRKPSPAAAPEQQRARRETGREERQQIERIGRAERRHCTRAARLRRWIEGHRVRRDPLAVDRHVHACPLRGLRPLEVRRRDPAVLVRLRRPDPVAATRAVVARAQLRDAAVLDFREPPERVVEEASRAELVQGAADVMTRCDAADRRRRVARRATLWIQRGERVRVGDAARAAGSGRVAAEQIADRVVACWYAAPRRRSRRDASCAGARARRSRSPRCRRRRSRCACARDRRCRRGRPCRRGERGRHRPPRCRAAAASWRRSPRASRRHPATSTLRGVRRRSMRAPTHPGRRRRSPLPSGIRAHRAAT